MAKRRLTNKQERRIAQKQKSLITEDTADALDLNSTTNGTVISHFGKQLIVETDDKSTYKCKLRQNLGNIACGDNVLIKTDETSDSPDSVVVAINERRNLLEKTGFGGKAKPVAANIDQVVIVCSVEPEPNHYLIDRYLVATENLPAKPIIVLNKIDIDSTNKTRIINELQAVYETIGYNVILTSIKSIIGLEELNAMLENATSIFVGLSGVGKSSLAQAFLPDTEIRIGKTSESTGEGKHTTTVSSLYHLENGGHLIDSPGVRDFTPNKTSKQEIEHGFTELRKYLGLCKFSNCTHEHEPGCAILDALKKNEVTLNRVNSFKKMLSESETASI